jgi:hypothetical protein
MAESGFLGSKMGAAVEDGGNAQRNPEKESSSSQGSGSHGHYDSSSGVPLSTAFGHKACHCRGQIFWLRHASALFASSLDSGNPLVRWWAIATVTPSTNVTVLNLPYQSYLNAIFHRTRLAKVGHAVCMPVIVTAALAALCPLRLGGAPASADWAPLVNASLPAVVALAVWWTWWAVKERDALWGVCNVAMAVALYALANAYAHWGPHAIGGVAIGSAPLAWMLLGSLLQAGSHVLEPLPPRVTRSAHWIPVGEYLLGPSGRRNARGTVLRRAGQLAAQTLFGTVDELVASPRLLPVLLLRLLWLAGHNSVRLAVSQEQAARAIAGGNPALDYIGTGGATPLRIPVTVPIA